MDFKYSKVVEGDDISTLGHTNLESLLESESDSDSDTGYSVV